MTDADIIKALECCKVCRNPEDCGECPYEGCTSTKGCLGEMIDNTLDLINRLQADKEALIAGQETLQKNLPKVIRVEAIREFAERLKAEAEIYCSAPNGAAETVLAVCCDNIDNLVKEMTEDSNE